METGGHMTHGTNKGGEWSLLQKMKHEQGVAPGRLLSG